MRRFLCLALLAVCGVLVAAPVPPLPGAKTLVAGLGDPSDKVRDQTGIALRGRADALPWLRRAARSADKDTARRANSLLVSSENSRQEAVSKFLGACISDGQADLFIEWHHFWQPKSKDELWSVGPRMARAGLDLSAKKLPHEGDLSYLEQHLGLYLAERKPPRHLDGQFVIDDFGAAWRVRTDRIDLTRFQPFVPFASVAGPVYAHGLKGGCFFSLGPVHADHIWSACVICDGSVVGTPDRWGELRFSRVSVHNSFVACRGNFTAGSEVRGSILLVSGDIDLSRTSVFKDSVIRALGEVQLPKNPKFENCTIEAHAKNATAPYKFFELADVGLSLADDEEGLVVTTVKADTPFGNAGLAKGDLIRAIDDVLAGNSEEFRKAVRRALVRQGDCLLTVTRGDKNHDLPVFFPLPK